MRLRSLLVAAICALLAPSASAMSRAVITERDSGKIFHLPRGHDRTLRLSNRYRWTEPRVKGNAVRLIRVDYFVDPGFEEWTIRARARGRARISAVGYREGARRGCDPGPCTPKLFRIVVIVP